VFNDNCGYLKNCTDVNLVLQANFRKTKVASKLKITYLKGSLLDVCVLPCSENTSSDNERYVQVKVQYNACSLFKPPYSIFRMYAKSLYYTGDEWTDCFSAEGITLPSAPFLGFSAMTGDVFDAHEYVVKLFRSTYSTSEPISLHQHNICIILFRDSREG
jgi:hypothetical protein